MDFLEKQSTHLTCAGRPNLLSDIDLCQQIPYNQPDSIQIGDPTLQTNATIRQTASSDQNLVCTPSWLVRKTWPKINEDAEPLYIVDLFCGSGGLTLGAFEASRQLGRRPIIKLAVDADLDYLSVYRKNFRVNCSTARNVKVERLCRRTLRAPLSEHEQVLKGELGRVDILLAGPPCQGHSDLNNSTRRNDSRNRLYLHAIRFVQMVQPRVVIIENVPTIRHDSSRVLTESIRTLKLLGYYVQDVVIDISNLGLAQQRKRHVLIATKEEKEEICIQELNPKNAISVVLHDLLDAEPSIKPSIFDTPSELTDENVKRIKYLFANGLHDLPNKLRPPCHRFKKHSYVSMYGRLRWDRPAQTITSGFGSPGQGRYIHPLRERLITPHEASRLQGFPDFFKFDSVSKRGKLREMIANAVPPVLSATILLNVLKQR